jgi:hypothetical protein
MDVIMASFKDLLGKWSGAEVAHKIPNSRYATL